MEIGIKFDMSVEDVIKEPCETVPIPSEFRRERDVGVLVFFSDRSEHMDTGYHNNRSPFLAVIIASAAIAAIIWTRQLPPEQSKLQTPQDYHTTTVPPNATGDTIH